MIPPDSADDARQPGAPQDAPDRAPADAPPRQSPYPGPPPEQGPEAIAANAEPTVDDAPTAAAEAVPDALAPEAARPRRRLFRRRRDEPPADALAPEPAPAEGEATPAAEEAPAAVQAVEPAPAEAAPAAPAPAPAPRGRIRPGVLRRRRRALQARYEQGLFDLGGLAVEMHRHDLLGDGVLARRAAEMRDVEGQMLDIDRTLDEIERDRQVRGEAGRGASRCPVCGTPFRPAATYCWNCGTRVREPAPGEAPAGAQVQGAEATAPADAETTQVLPSAVADQPTAVIVPPGGGPT